MAAKKAAAKKAAAPKFVQVERKASKRGRKSVEKAGMKAMVEAWATLEVGATYPLPDYSDGNDHAKLTLARHHFKKYASSADLRAGVDYTIEGHDEYGATVTRLA